MLKVNKVWSQSIPMHDKGVMFEMKSKQDVGTMTLGLYEINLSFLSSKILVVDSYMRLLAPRQRK